MFHSFLPSVKQTLLFRIEQALRTSTTQFVLMRPQLQQAPGAPWYRPKPQSCGSRLRIWATSHCQVWVDISFKVVTCTKIIMRTHMHTDLLWKRNWFFTEITNRLLISNAAPHMRKLRSDLNGWFLCG